MADSGYPAIVPYLLYRDVPAALDWLAAAFGFTERYRVPGEDGSVNHAEMEFGGGVVMLGGPGGDYRNPKDLGGATALQFVTVPDVDAHHARSVEAGATVVAELDERDYGRSYGVADPEGHQWYFVAARS
jgi:uncharacterized glyoxalase superfamily protein PhnB